MKKFFVLFLVLFWSMIFPNLSLNPLTTELTSSEIRYSELSEKKLRDDLLENAEFDFWLWHHQK